MIQRRSMLAVADNTGAKIVQCIGILGGTKKRYARVGDIIVGVVKQAEPQKAVKTHDIVRAVLVRQKKPFLRNDGTWLRFDDNAVVLLDGLNPKGSRILGPVPRELRDKGFVKIISMAREVV